MPIGYNVFENGFPVNRRIERKLIAGHPRIGHLKGCMLNGFEVRIAFTSFQFIVLPDHGVVVRRRNLALPNI